MVLFIKYSMKLRRFCIASSVFAVSNHFLHYTITPDHTDIIEVNHQLKDLSKTGNLREAHKLFDKMPERDVISWTNMISCYVNAMDPIGALALFSDLRFEHGIVIDPFAVSLALKACRLSFNVNCGESLHGVSIKNGLVNSVFVGTSLLDMYMKIGKIDESCKVFDKMPLRNVVSWTAIITGLVHAGFHYDGLLNFSEMWRSRVVCDSNTYAIALKACADLGALYSGREIHTHVVKKGFDKTSFVANSLATMYNKCRKLNYGLCLFENMSSPDVVSWTSIITSFVHTGCEENAIKAFMKMKESGVNPNGFTFAVVLSGCASLSRIEWGEQLHAHILCFGFADYLSVMNSVMTMYIKCGKLNSASAVFSGMSKKDIISWSTIIGGYCQGGYDREAFEYFKWMRERGPKPTEAALANLLTVCGNVAILDQGRQMHGHVLLLGLEQEPTIHSALINMYSKCGSVREALNIFEESGSDDIVSWTAMIDGYAEHGYSTEAIKLFEKVKEFGLVPDSVTFIGVLKACSHSGQVELGYHYFDSMYKKYGILPSKEHYGCMVNLLCHAGRLKEAEQMIEDMPCEKDYVVWSSLLHGSRVHGDVDCGKRAAEKVLELDPNCAGTHITLANIYAAKGKWREAADVRKRLKSKGVIKEPGWSWIKVKDELSAFTAGDWSHYRAEDIYGVLNLLVPRAEIGIHDFDCFLNDFENY